MLNDVNIGIHSESKIDSENHIFDVMDLGSDEKSSPNLENYQKKFDDFEQHRTDPHG